MTFIHRYCEAETKTSSTKRRAKERILCHKCKYVTVGYLVKKLLYNIMKFSSTVFIKIKLFNRTKPNYCYYKFYYLSNKVCCNTSKTLHHLLMEDTIFTQNVFPEDNGHENTGLITNSVK